MRLSRIFRNPASTDEPEAIPLGRVLAWGFFGVVLVVGLVLYFKYERLVVPLLN